MTVFTVTVYMQNYTLTSKQSNKHILMDYTQHQVYHIKTEDENYPHARKAIASIMEDKLGYK